MLSMALATFLFWAVAALTSLSAIAVVVAQNIVRAAVWLLFTLAGTAGLFFLLGADFVGSTQLIVYVGGTLVLVVFGVMLTAQGPFITMKTGAAEWAISTVVGLLFLGVLTISILGTPWTLGKPSTPMRPGESMSSVSVGKALLGVNEATPKGSLTGMALPKKDESPIELPRQQVSYLLPFEIVSVH